MYEIQSATIQRHLYDLDFFLNSLLLIYNETPVFLKKWANPGTFTFIFIGFNQTSQFLQQINVTNVHLVSGAGIRTHNLLITSLLF